ncbi:type II CRISPR-associated endonuclease Cas1 [Schleiferilactobacillus harbinensis]|jgi:CRISPR-associated protein Cas1|uniref:type II CRISPR-associated endonuclease Cas1 n=1 Tax=Schleiferilactobacillus harbinensis TaxID=304207 RepID=UPI00242BC4EB|nr:type II CRISPR-associated endonuclease Cas1 [Schleiferilactobacillus harbinensis]MCI1687505.1 type II CRISPR-associated endonuclease Cas1 [Schleiferilactobacillus harbinensis]MCI1783901.1 type II CRISPR-associated endonuclease Cas1 [Schleiferilactobacillus harbinensis]MCI1851828.1 type II CRISPR-associated endonuclease Cas1 [Schleiferilactobacillus harbinensis]
MGYRNLFVESPAALSIKNAQLRVKTAKEFTFPLDDLQSILIDDPRSTVSMTVLSQLGQHNIAVIVSDAQHLPGSVLLPLQGYYHKLTTLNQQLSVTKRFKNRLWQKNIRQKILNQAAVLDWQNLNGVAEMKQYAASVLEGDRTHQEGYAAAFYFRVAFGKHFVRRNDDTVNAALNYGYAIIRSCVARELSAFGFEPALGIFHRNQLNPFNLADDLIEPFRPIVDLQVLQMDLDDQPALTPDIKKQLLNLQSMDVKIDGSFQTVRNAIHLTIESVGAAFTQGKVSGITLPQVIPLVPHGFA